MFVKLLNGDLVNTSAIARIERYTTKVPDPTLPDTQTVEYKYWTGDRRPRVERPAIRVWMNPETELFYGHFDTEEEREAEMKRLEEAVMSKPTLIFPSLAIQVGSIQSVFFSWSKEGSFGDYGLVVTIQVANAEPYIIKVTPDIQLHAESLAKEFKIDIPGKPKSAVEFARELAERRADQKPNATDYINQ